MHLNDGLNVENIHVIKVSKPWKKLTRQNSKYVYLPQLDKLHSGEVKGFLIMMA